MITDIEVLKGFTRLLRVDNFLGTQFYLKRLNTLALQITLNLYNTRKFTLEQVLIVKILRKTFKYSRMLPNNLQYIHKTRELKQHSCQHIGKSATPSINSSFAIN